MKRDEFITSLGIGLAAVCAGCLGACSKGDDDPDNGPGPIIPPSNVNTTIDLNSDLKNIGDSKVVSGVIVVRLAASNVPASFTAVQVACTHEGTAVLFNSSLGRFKCPNHGSEFSTSGTVQPGWDAKTNLKAYNIAIAGTTLTITG